MKEQTWIIREIPRRHCTDKTCRYAGRLNHRAHSVCKMAACLDRGLAYHTHHRVKVDA